MTISDSKQALKQLRQHRKAHIERARLMIKEQNKRIAAIKSRLESEPQTVPEIAEALHMDTAEAMVFVSALRKYGQVEEDVKDGDYFRYRIAGRTAS